ncbi:MAG: hypothetical protein RL354_2635 [Planctomycetota bacterium]|jgi:hypothetical protein
MPSNDEEDLHPADHAWRRDRFAAGALIFGFAGLLSSPLLLGLALGPLGMRSGVDLWRARVRRPVVAAGIAVSFVATVASIAAAVVWGAVLARVLLSRDVMRETEKWRGTQIAETSVLVTDALGTRTRALAPAEGSPRLVILFIEAGTGPCADAVRTLAWVSEHAGGREPSGPRADLLIVEQREASSRAREFALEHGLDVGVLGAGATLPAPLDGVFALPTIVVIDRDRRIEAALVGSRTIDEVGRLFTGSAALEVRPTPP